MQELSRDEYSFKAERDHLDDATPCKCGSCCAAWRYDQLRPIGDCSLTPGDASPAGRCADPSCDSLAYPDRPEDRAAAAGPALTAFPPPAPRDAIGLRDPYVAACAEKTGPDVVGAILRAALDLYDAGWGSKSNASFEARQRLGDALVSYNGAPFGFRGPLSPDAPPIESFPRGAALAPPLTAQTAPYGVAQAVASAAGYVVRRDSADVTRWCALTPAGRFLAVAMLSEASAWEAAYQHHRARTPDPGEFSRAVSLGYTVREEEPGAWVAMTPDGSIADVYYDTERAAWEACDRHRTGATPTTRAAVSGDDFPV